MRVAILSPHFPPVVGGIATFSRELVAGLRSRGVECRGYGRQGETSGDWEIIDGGVLRYTWRSFLEILRWRPDAVHAHAHWYCLVPGALLRLVHPTTRLVFTFHTQPDAKKPWALASMRVALLFCTHVTFVSKDLKRRVGTFFQSNESVIYPGPEPAMLHAIDSTEFIRRFSLGGYILVLFVGPLVWPLKVEGVRCLVESFASIAAKHERAKLVVVGDGPLRQALEDESHRLLGDQVVFTGNMKDVGGPISACTIYAHISFQEGLPISLLNAMAQGKPVVATAIGGIPEVVTDGQTGLLVPPIKQEITRALDELLSNPELRQRLGAFAASFVRTTLTWERTTDQVVQCYGGP